jgi:Ni,Fe-hydrogenase I small subunit
VIGASDKIGAFPAASPQKPENMAATIYQALGIPQTAAWLDQVERPNHIYHGDPIEGLC